MTVVRMRRTRVALIVDLIWLAALSGGGLALWRLPAWGWLTRVVVPARRSRTKTFEVLLPVLVPLVVPPVVEVVVMLSALESKATKRPSAEIAGW